jgi:hypothetical protein
MLDLARDPLAVLGTLGASVLNEHTDQAGMCAVCKSAWPCKCALLAEHNLGAL